jgi:hypothetical protein
MMKNSLHKRLFIIFLACMQLACILTLGSSEEDDISKEQTSVALTIEALEKDKPPKQESPASEKPQPKPTKKPQEQAAPPTKTPKPCNDVEFISETIPDGSEYGPGDSFTKSWRFKNIGTCTWNTNYKFVFKDGDKMSAPANNPLSSEVAPGETVDISVDMTAPASAGAYQGFWKMVADDGDAVVHNVWVKIVVKSAPFAVTGVSLSVIPPLYTGPCPFPFQFTADITSSAEGTVTYYWERDDGGQFAHGFVNFESAGTKTVNTVWPQVVPGPHWMKIYIDTPNHQYFGPVNYSLNCLP